MIQDIGRNTIDTEFAKPKPQDSDYVLIFEKTDVFVFRGTTGVDTCHNVDSTKLALLTYFIAFVSRLCLFLE